MKIDSGYLGMESARRSTSSHSVRMSTETRVSGNSKTGSQLTQFFSQFLFEEETGQSSEGNFKNGQNSLPEDDIPLLKAENSPILLDAFDRLSAVNNPRISMTRQRSDTVSTFQKLHQKFLQEILEMLYKKHRKSKDDSVSDNSEVPAFEAEPTYELVATKHTSTLTYMETESVSFQALGQVKTDDGREININLNLSMSKTFVASYSDSVSYLSYRLTDPLVINLSDAPSELTDLSFFFDLDADGKEEEIYGLSSNSGYLALDKNGDGKINDGSELFGTRSGDGFKDLAQYDEDHNGWIDENDAIFDKLKIWVKDSLGNDQLYSLKDKNVGAININSQDTDFELSNSSTDSTKGFIRKTGIFLYETGAVGTMQHVDLVS